ncbi:hypothetical protein PG989_015274 [Apiospora arundinis]
MAESSEFAEGKVSFAREWLVAVDNAVQQQVATNNAITLYNVMMNVRAPVLEGLYRKGLQPMVSGDFLVWNMATAAWAEIGGIQPCPFEEGMISPAPRCTSNRHTQSKILRELSGDSVESQQQALEQSAEDLAREAISKAMNWDGRATALVNFVEADQPSAPVLDREDRLRVVQKGLARETADLHQRSQRILMETEVSKAL